ncbi:hypothetical protein D3C81_2322020 [compost metagenome]
MVPNTSCIAGASPIIPTKGFGSVVNFLLAFCSLVCSNALLVMDTASSISKGLGKYSNAPP